MSFIKGLKSLFGSAQKDPLKTAGISPEDAMERTGRLHRQSVANTLYADRRTVDDPSFPVPPHIEELRALLAKVMPGGKIYGSALYNESLRRAHPELQLTENDIDIGLTDYDISEISVDTSVPGVADNIRAASTNGTPPSDFYVQIEPRNRVLTIQSMLPQIEWDSPDNVQGCVSGSQYDNISGDFTGRWTDSAGKTHRLQFNLAKNSLRNKFLHGDSVMTSVTMTIGSGAVERYADQPDHARRLIFASTMDISRDRAAARFETLKARIPGLVNVGSYHAMPEVEKIASEFRARSGQLNQIVAKLKAHKTLTAAEAALILTPEQ